MQRDFDTGAQTPLAEEIVRQLHDQRGVEIAAAENDKEIFLSGRVPTQRDKAEAHALAARLAHGKKVVDTLLVEEILPDDYTEESVEDLADADRPENVLGVDTNDDPDAYLNDQGLNTDELQSADSGAAEDLNNPGDIFESQDDDGTFFPPTDPVIGVDEDGNTTVVNGFAPTSESDQEVEPSYEDAQPGDEALVDAVLRELREDATTTDLRIRVAANQGVVYLRGTVPTVEDSDNAESVASNVPGVREVIEQLTVSDE